jgi:hypothetical protein
MLGLTFSILVNLFAVHQPVIAPVISSVYPPLLPRPILQIARSATQTNYVLRTFLWQRQVLPPLLSVTMIILLTQVTVDQGLPYPTLHPK